MAATTNREKTTAKAVIAAGLISGRGYRGQGAGPGVTPLLHTDRMEVVDVDRAAEHRGFSIAVSGVRVSGQRGPAEGSGRAAGRHPVGTQAQGNGVTPTPSGPSTRWRDHDWQPLAGDALLERLRITGPATP